MATLKDLLAQQAALQKKIDEVKASETSSAISNIRAIIEEYGLSQADVFPSSKGKSTGKGSTLKGTKVPPKYKNDATGETWTGRGNPPVWISGKDKSKYLIGKP